MTETELRAAIARVETALDALLLGERVAEVSYDGRTVKYQMANIGDLRRRLAELRADLARVTGEASGRRAITIGWKG